jgi:dienelactone hydrolase
MKRVFKIIALVVAVLLLVAVIAFAWFATRPPKPAKMIDPAPAGQRIEADGIIGNYFPAAGYGPGILLLGGSEGGLARDLYRQAVLLQRAGYHVLHLAYHNAPGKPANLTNVPLEDFRRGLDWLKARPEVDGSSIGIIGYSKGAEAALLTATRYPGIKAVVLGMPSSVAWDGLDTPSILFGLNSSWSEGGKPVASLGYGFFDPARGLYGVFEDGLKKLGEHPEAIIPVERVKAKVLMVCGEKDELWPACPMAEQVAARARAKGGRETELLRYPDAGHGAMGAPGPASDPDIVKFAKLGGTAAANAAARGESWARITAYLREALPRAAMAPAATSADSGPDAPKR